MVRTPDKIKGPTESHSILCGIKLRYSIYSFIVQIRNQLANAFFGVSVNPMPWPLYKPTLDDF